MIVKVLNCYCYNELISFPIGKAMHARRHVCAPQAGHKRAFWFPATLAPFSSVLSPLPPVAWGGAVLTFGLPLSRLGKADASIALRSLLHRLTNAQSTHRKPAANRQAAQRISAICEGERRHEFSTFCSLYACKDGASRTQWSSLQLLRRRPFSQPYGCKDTKLFGIIEQLSHLFYNIKAKCGRGSLDWPPRPAK